MSTKAVTAVSGQALPGPAISATVLAVETCPICKHEVDPQLMQGAYESLLHVGGVGAIKNLQVVFRCPRSACQKLYIGSYTGQPTTTALEPAQFGYWTLREVQPSKPYEEDFDPKIQEISSAFVRLYNQAFAAEHYGLDEICGVGYGKSLEFLVKDYLCLRDPIKTDEIKAKSLSSCIKNFVDDPKLKSVAERAVWLRNDETHYIRKWDDKDLRDLKITINLVVHWIMAEVLTAQLEADMPK